MGHVHGHTHGVCPPPAPPLPHHHTHTHTSTKKSSLQACLPPIWYVAGEGTISCTSFERAAVPNRTRADDDRLDRGWSPMPDTVESYAPGPGSPLRSAPPTRGDLPMEYDGARSFLLSATVCGSYCEEPEPHSTRSGCTHVDVAGWTHAGGGAMTCPKRCSHRRQHACKHYSPRGQGSLSPATLPWRSWRTLLLGPTVTHSYKRHEHVQWAVICWAST